MTPTCFEIIPNRWFRRDFPDAPSGVPLGNLLEVCCNPYNGQLVVSFQRSEAAMHLVEFALESIEGPFGNFARPVIDREPRNVLRTVR